METAISNNRKVALKICHAKKTYGEGDAATHALDDVSLEVYEGEVLVILGSSGSGKSTLLNVIGGIDTLDSGQLLYKGEDVATFDDYDLTDYRRDEVGFVFQFFNLINDLTVAENIMLAPGANQDEETVDKILGLVGILDKKNSYPTKLSGGQQQRVSIARALNKRSSLLLCDEPTGALDKASGRDVLKLLQDLNRQGRTIVIVTHANEVAKIAHRVVEMRDGKIVEIRENDKVENAEEVNW